MKRIAALMIPAALIALPAAATEIDCFPMCGQEGAPQAAFDACRVAVVQQGVKLDAKLRPVKQVYEIATDPTGFAIKTVADAAGIKVPRVVGYALNPKGSLKSEVVKRLREAAKQQVGMGHDCAEEIAGANVAATRQVE